MEVDERLKKELGAGRRSREMDDRSVTEDRVATEDDRLRMFQQQMYSDALPNLPEIPGYHVCWLTTTNPRDPIHTRIMWGYEPIKSSEIKGLEYLSLKTGEYAGMIGVNEMVAFKLPESLYQRIMQVAHHDRPAVQENMIASTIESQQIQAERSGGRLIQGEGMSELGRNIPARGVFT
jgi:hypothetical protein